MHRPRLYWGNRLLVKIEPVKVSLQEKLAKNCNRIARVIKLRTITRQDHSLLRGQFSYVR